MTAEDVEIIEKKIKQAEEQAMKAAGAIESIETRWRTEFQLKDEAAVDARLSELKEQITAQEERQKFLSEKLQTAYDWSTL